MVPRAHGRAMPLHGARLYGALARPSSSGFSKHEHVCGELRTMLPWGASWPSLPTDIAHGMACDCIYLPPASSSSRLADYPLSESLLPPSEAMCSFLSCLHWCPTQASLNASSCLCREGNSSGVWVMTDVGW